MGKREQGRGNHLIPHVEAGQGSPSQHWGLREGLGAAVHGDGAELFRVTT